MIGPECISWLSKQSDFYVVEYLDVNTIGIKRHYKTSICLALSFNIHHKTLHLVYLHEHVLFLLVFEFVVSYRCDDFVHGIRIGNSMTCSGIWKILKYYESVLLPNTTCRSQLNFKPTNELTSPAETDFADTLERTLHWSPWIQCFLCDTFCRFCTSAFRLYVICS